MDLQKAEAWAVQACSQGGTIRAAWKLLGNVKTAHLHVDPHTEQAAANSDGVHSTAEDALARSSFEPSCSHRLSS